MSYLEEYLRPSLYISELKSKRKSSVLEELVGRLASEHLTRHPNQVLDAVRRRESMGGTGLGKGIAVPHARSTLVKQRAVVIARSTKGVEFDSPDGKPAHLLFLLVAPPLEKDPVYLNLMAEIVGAVRLARTRQRLLDAADFKAFRRILLEAIRD
jgi:mannitol/fructose-specific phosphotransferase system IIA component (Ntr-type)